jgi:hypothetical protein
MLYSAARFRFFASAAAYCPSYCPLAFSACRCRPDWPPRRERFPHRGFVLSLNGQLRLECDKQKDSEACKPLAIRLVPIADSLIVRNGGATITNSSPIDHRYLEALSRIQGLDGARAKDWLTHLNATESTFLKRVANLVTKGYVEHRVDRYSLTDKGRLTLSPPLLALAA